MSEGQIRQELGFDAQQALDELAKLDTAFANFGNQLAATVSRIGYFNDNAGKIVAALKQMSSQADATISSFANLASINPQAPATGGSSGAFMAGQMAQAAQTAQAFGSLTTAANQAAQAITNAGNASASAIQKANQHTQNWAISWQTLARVVMTQAIVRTLSAIRDGVRASYEGFLQFSKQIGEIRAIDPDRSFGQIAENVRALSDAFNQPLDRVAEAQYQTISDQFTTAADRANILTAANALAKVSAQDLADAAMLLTGALNAYGESSDNAAMRAAQFDKTIELGRLRMGELGTALGRIQTIGHELGVSLEELQAGLITLTIGGLKANEAATQMRGIMTGLLKPSQGMKDAFSQLGVESGEAAIATWGLKGALDQLDKLTAGSASMASKLFPNIRGLAGDLRIVREGAEKYEEAMRKLQQVDQNTLNAKLQDFISTDAEKLTAELNRISNFFKADFGAELVKSLRQIIMLIGGSDGVVGVARILTRELGTVAACAAGLGLVGAALGYMKLQAEMAKYSVSGLRAATLLLVGLPIAESLGQMAGNKLYDMQAAPHRELEAQTEAIIKMDKQQADAGIREADRKNKEILKGLRQYGAEAAKEYATDTENFKTAMKITENIVKQSLDNILQARRKLTNELNKISEDAAKKAEQEIPQKIADLQTGIGDRSFQYAIRGRDADEQFRWLSQRARQAAEEAASLSAHAKDTDQEKAADAAWKRAEGFAKQTEELSKIKGHEDLQRQSLFLLNDLDSKRIDALRQQQQLQRQLSEEAASRAKVAEQHNEELDAQRQAIEKTLKLTEDDGQGGTKFKSHDQLGKDLLAAQQMIAKFKELYTKYGQEDFAKAFMGDTRAFDSMRREIERAMVGTQMQTIEVAPEAIAAMHDEIEARLAELKTKCPVIAQIEKVTGLDLVTDGLTKMLDEYEKKLSEVTARSIRRTQASHNMEAAQNEFTAEAAKFAKEPENTSMGGRTPAGIQRILDARASIEGVVAQMDRLRQSGAITDEQMQKVRESVASIGLSGTLGAALPGLVNANERTRVTEELDKMVKALQRVKDAQDLLNQNKVQAGEASKEELQNIQETIDSTYRKQDAQADVNTKASEGKQAAVDTNTAILSQISSTSTEIGIVSSLAASWSNVAAQAARASKAGAGASGGGGGGGGTDDSGDWGGDWSGDWGGDVEAAAMGGLIRYFDRGGFARRGTDVIPAMLSPGEFVMSARATRRFYSQLLAMNAGITPNYRAQGGQGGNVTIGDIHINEASEPRQTAREVIKSLKRELRRGTSAF